MVTTFFDQTVLKFTQATAIPITVLVVNEAPVFTSGRAAIGSLSPSQFGSKAAIAPAGGSR